MSDKAVGAGSSGPPAVCLLHLNFEPCPWCEPQEGGEVPPFQIAESEPRGLGVPPIEAAVIDTTPRRRRPRR